MKKIYSFALALICAALLTLTFVSCEKESEKEEQKKEEQKNIDPKQWESAINGTWEYSLKNQNFVESESHGGSVTTRTGKRSEVERYIFNTASKKGSYYYKSETLYYGETTPRITVTDYDFTYEFNLSFDDFFERYSASVKLTVTDIREGSKYLKTGETRYLDIRSMTDKELTLGMDTFTKK